MCRYSHLVKYLILLLIADCSWSAVTNNTENNEVQIAQLVERIEQSTQQSASTYQSNENDAMRIAQLEELIEQNNRHLLQLQAKLEAETSGRMTTAEPCCAARIGEKENELTACQIRAKMAEDKLKGREDYFAALLQNLTSCQISLMDREDQTQNQTELAQLAELEAQLKSKDEKILELRKQVDETLIQLKAAQNKIKAYVQQLEEFYPNSCLPFGSTTGIYRIKLPDLDSFYVPCDARLAGSGWLVIQRRMDGSVDFYRNWTDYKAGFGALSGEFFLGLEKLHQLTARQPYELYVHLEDFEGEIRYAHYDNFTIGSESTAYELSSLGRYDGTAGNSMGLNVLQKFSTHDNDNDSWPEGNCARRYHSAWWYASCAAFCNPNGKYFKRRQLSTNARGKGIIWQHWHGFEEALKFVQLMIRPISTTHF